MKTFVLSALILLGLSAVALPQTGTRVIASTKTWSITEQQFEAILNALPDQAKELFATPENKRKFLDDLVQMWVLADEARTKGFDQAAARKAVISFYSNNIVASDYKDFLADNSHPSDAEIAAYYKANEGNYAELNLSHIMILNGDSPQVKERQMEGALPSAEAKKKLEDIRTRIQGGADFAALAKEFSQDKSSAEKGGDIGPIGQGVLVPAMDKAAFALKPGETSAIVESPVAFHILKVTDRHLQDLAEVKTEIREKMTASKLNDSIAAMIKEAGVTIDESYFKK